MLGWQYPEKVSAMMSYINTQLSTQEQAPKPSNKIEAIESAFVIQAGPQPIGVLAAPINTPIVTKISTKDILVTDWQTASANLVYRYKKLPLLRSAVTRSTVKKSTNSN